MSNNSPTKPAWNPTCAGYHFGVWMIQPEWFRGAVSAVREGLWKLTPMADAQPLVGQPAEPRRTLYTVVKRTAVIPIAGPMMKARSKYGGTSTVDVRAAIREAVRDEAVSSILVLVDSPGGTVAGTEALAQELADADKKKPAYAHIEDCGASAAYYVACQARRVTASPTSLVGSLGTMMVLDDVSKSNEMAGVKTYLISSGGMKGAGTEGLEVTEDQLAYFQGIVDDASQHFQNAVIRGRKMDAERVAELFDGRVHDAARALELGLIDAVVPVDSAIATVWEEVQDDEDDRIDRKPQKRKAVALPESIEEQRQRLIVDLKRACRPHA